MAPDIASTFHPDDRSLFQNSAVSGSNGTPFNATPKSWWPSTVGLEALLGLSGTRKLWLCSVIGCGLPRFGKLPVWWSGMPSERIKRYPSVVSMDIWTAASAGFVKKDQGLNAAAFSSAFGAAVGLTPCAWAAFATATHAINENETAIVRDLIILPLSAFRIVVFKMTA